MRTIATILAAVALAVPAAAAEPEAVTVRISTAGIDLTTAEGRAKLEERITAKVRKACTIGTASRYNYGRPVLDQACIAEARAEALAKAERVAAAKSAGGRQVSAN